MKIGIIGAGAFGTSLSHIIATFSNTPHEITLYAFENEVCESINLEHINHKYFPEKPLNKKIKAIGSLKAALENQDLILYVSPVKFTESLSKEFAKYEINSPIIICSKGIDTKNNQLVSEIFNNNLKGAEVGVLAGPCFASESYLGLPTALVLALKDIEKANKLIKKLDLTTLRLYSSQDIIGTQVGGAVKNIIAIGSGVISGLGLGQNAVASLLTRSLEELKLICLKLGGKEKTITGLSGLGDLVLTSSSKESRNFSLGEVIGKNNGYSEDLKPEKSGIAEGYFSAKSVYELGQKYSIDLPICSEIYKILYLGKTPREVMSFLLSRDLKEEF